MPFRIYGKPNTDIMPDEGILASWVKLAFGGGVSFEHPKAFQVIPTPNTDREFTMGGVPAGGLPSGYATSAELNRVGYQGLLFVQDSADAGKLDQATTSARWDMIGIQTAGADTAGGTATMVVLKGTEGNAAGQVTIPGESLGVKFIAIADVKVTPNVSAITVGQYYHVFAGRTQQVLDKTPPVANALPAGTGFMDPSGTSMKLRVTDAAGNVTTRGTSDVRLNGKSKAVIDHSSSVTTLTDSFLSSPQAYIPSFVVTEHNSSTVSSFSAVCRTKSGKVFALTRGIDPNSYGAPRTFGVVDPVAASWTTRFTYSPNTYGYAQGVLRVSDSENRIIYMPVDASGYLYNVATSTTTTIAYPGTSSRYAHYVVIGEDFYAIGGLDSSSQAQTTCCKLANGSTTWTTLTSCPTGGMDGYIATDGQYIYWQKSNTVLVYSIAGNTWTSLSSWAGSMTGRTVASMTYSYDGQGGVILWDSSTYSAHRLVGTNTTTTLIKAFANSSAYSWCASVQDQVQMRYDSSMQYTSKNGFRYDIQPGAAAGQRLQIVGAATPSTAYLTATATGNAIIEVANTETTKVQNRTRSVNSWSTRTSAKAGDVIDYFAIPTPTTITPSIIEMGGI